MSFLYQFERYRPYHSNKSRVMCTFDFKIPVFASSANVTVQSTLFTTIGTDIVEQLNERTETIFFFVYLF